METNHQRLIRSSTTKVSEFLAGENATYLDLSEAALVGLVLQNVSFERQLTQNVNERHRFCKANLERADLSGCIFSRVDFREAILVDSCFRDATFIGCDFSLAQARGCKFESANFVDCNFSGADLSMCNFFSAHLQGVSFIHSNLTGADFRKSKCSSADFSSANVSSANFHTARFRHLDLSKCENLEGCTIDRYVLEDRNADKWGLNKIRQLKRIDDFGLLKSQFSGVARFLAVTSIIAFLAPYVWFVTWHVILSRYNQAKDGKSVLVGLLQSMVSGNSTEPSWAFSWSFLLVLIFAPFHFLRMLLLFKTLSLETTHTVYGLYPDFSMDRNRFWQAIYWIVFYGTWLAPVLAIASALTHLYHIPIFEHNGMP